MAKKTKQRPVETLRDGAIKAAVWQNDSEKGVFFNVTFARTYKDGDGDLQDTDSFSGTQLLRLARLADKAYERTGELARQSSKAEKGKEDEEEA